ncbi:MAG: hypothetical protein AB1486_22945 [Planctomycetota bacterium]
MHEIATGGGGRRWRREAGLSLVEAAVAATFLAIAALVAFPTMISFFELSKTARQENIAFFDLESSLDDLRSTPYDELTERFPDGSILSKYTAFVPDPTGRWAWDDDTGDWVQVDLGKGTHRLNPGAHLRNEVVTVHYDDPTADPLNVSITIEWLDERGRHNNEMLTTAFTR